MGKNFSQLQEGGYICDNCLYSPQQQPGQLQANKSNKSLNNLHGSNGSLNGSGVGYSYGQAGGYQQPQAQYGGSAAAAGGNLNIHDK